MTNRGSELVDSLKPVLIGIFTPRESVSSASGDDSSFFPPPPPFRELVYQHIIWFHSPPGVLCTMSPSGEEY